MTYTSCCEIYSAYNLRLVKYWNCTFMHIFHVFCVLFKLRSYEGSVLQPEESLRIRKKAWHFLMGSTKYELFPSLHLVMETDPVSEILCLNLRWWTVSKIIAIDLVTQLCKIIHLEK